MAAASEELEWRTRYLSSLIQRAKLKPEADLQPETANAEEVKQENQRPPEKERVKRADGDGSDGDPEEEEKWSKVRVRAVDMPPPMQRRAFRRATEEIGAMAKLDSKRLALALKKEFDSSYGPAWHCIVGTSFGSYVTHSLGGFLYFSIGKVYILLFRTAVEALDHRR